MYIVQLYIYPGHMVTVRMSSFNNTIIKENVAAFVYTSLLTKGAAKVLFVCKTGLHASGGRGRGWCWRGWCGGGVGRGGEGGRG